MNRFLFSTFCSLLFPATAFAIIDTNENGLSDLWEKQFNNGILFFENFDPNYDEDSDGWTNAQEAAAGTDPFDPNPPDGFLLPQTTYIPATWHDPDEDGNPDILTPEAFTVTWTSIPGKLYTLQVSTDLSAGSWLEADTPFVGSGNIIEYTFLLQGSERCFWRVAVIDTDSDSDTLTDAEEHSLGTDPSLTDSDGDGMSDGWEVANGLDPNDDGKIDSNNGAGGDPDGDGITNDSDSTPQTVDELVIVVETTKLEVYFDQDGFHRTTNTFTSKCSVDRLMNRLPPPTQVANTVVNVSFDTEADFGFLEKAKIWIEASEAVDHDRKVNFFDVLDTDYPSLISAQPSIVVRDPVEFTIPSNATRSEDFETDPGITDLTVDTPSMQQAAFMSEVKVSWKPIDGWDNVDAHIDPWTKKENGFRIFPDFENPTKSTIRHAIEVVLYTSPALVGKTIYLKAFDVDDSTSEEFDKDGTIGAPTYGDPIIDLNGEAGDDNQPDYLETQLNGQFWTGANWGSNLAQSVIDSTGKAKIILRIGMQPGNNYRVVGSVFDQSMFAGVQTSSSAIEKYLGPKPEQNGKAPATEMLTVWRKLWAENDSMEAIPIEGGNLRNDLTSDIVSPEISNFLLDSSGADTILSISPISDYSSFFKLEKGNIVFQGSSHPVIGTAVIAPGQSGAYAVKISGNHTSYPPGTSFLLYDDDGFGLDAASLPRQDLVNDQMKEYFFPSFVDVVDAGAYNSPNLITLSLNEDVSENNPLTVVDNEIDLVDKNACWVCPIIAAYQGPQTEDQDPAGDPESFLMGETTPHGDYDDADYYEFSTVFVETCRENYDTLLRSTGPGIAAKQPARLKKWITAVISHEMGHQPGNELDEHPEGGLMGAPMDVSISSPETAKFSPKTIKRFRKANRWSR